MNDELLRNVEDLGLSNKEARVYVANLMLGPATVQKIADKADIKRVTTYVILESLVALGLVSQTNQAKKTYFTAEDPVSLRRLLQKKAEQVADQKANFENILPELQSLKNFPSDSPNVKFYDSAEGVKSIMRFVMDLRRQSKVLHCIINANQVFEFFPELEAAQTVPEAIKPEVMSYFIYTHTDGPVLASTDAERMRHSRYVPCDNVPLNGDLIVVENHIILLSLAGNKPVGIVIDSKYLADGFRAVFWLAWNGAQPYEG